MTFQRARSEEQREARRRAILGTARSMLAEMPVSAISLNELSRRVGLAKSNVLRYFESREAVLLELLDAAWREWLDALAAELVVDPAAPLPDRVDRVATVLAATLVARPVLCELGSASTAVLEHNVSTAVATRFKRAALDDTDALARRVRDALPELAGEAAQRFAWTAVLTLGGLWAATRPSPAMLAAYEADPALAVLHLDFGDALAELLATLLAGLLARPPR